MGLEEILIGIIAILSTAILVCIIIATVKLYKRKDAEVYLFTMCLISILLLPVGLIGQMFL